MWKEILLVGTGGFLGSVSRYLLGGWTHAILPRVAFPVGTVVVNILGCFFIGLFAGFIEHKQLFGPDARLFLLIGLLGGFTTFSTFTHETLALARDAQYLRAGGNVLLQVLLGLIAAWIGYGLPRN
jgi:CrcB protein